jgi:hypothetical protein
MDENELLQVFASMADRWGRMRTKAVMTFRLFPYNAVCIIYCMYFNKLNKLQKFYSLPKRYKTIQRFQSNKQNGGLRSKRRIILQYIHLGSMSNEQGNIAGLWG